jgi:hypothetical protein
MSQGIGFEIGSLPLAPADQTSWGEAVRPPQFWWNHASARLP